MASGREEPTHRGGEARVQGRHGDVTAVTVGLQSAASGEGCRWKPAVEGREEQSGGLGP